VPEWQDDPSISNNERLLRRVHPSQIKPDPESGEARPSSAAFKSSTGLTSVSIASLTTPDAVLVGYEKHSLVEFEAAIARSAGCIVVRAPETDNPAHANVIGTGPGGRVKNSEAKTIANRAQWVVLRPPWSQGNKT
jgi:hypothetical protein